MDAGPSLFLLSFCSFSSKQYCPQPPSIIPQKSQRECLKLEESQSSDSVPTFIPSFPFIHRPSYSSSPIVKGSNNAIVDCRAALSRLFRTLTCPIAFGPRSGLMVNKSVSRSSGSTPYPECSAVIHVPHNRARRSPTLFPFNVMVLVTS